MRFVLKTVIFAVLFPAVVTVAAEQCPQFLSGQQVGAVESGQINEASGIVASRKNVDVFWINNDSGDSARVFAMNSEGIHLGIYNLGGCDATDYEDIAIGPGPEPNKDYLYIGDIGDNDSSRAYIKVYRVSEPVVDVNQSPVNTTLTGVDTIKLQYPDGARDAETLMVEPITKDIYIISKRETPSKLYRAAYPQSTTTTTIMEYKCQLPWGGAVGGDISPAGNIIIVKCSSNASVWYRPADTNLWEAFDGQECDVPLILEPQGEAICFDADGCGYYTVSEKLNQPIYYFERSEQCPLTGDINSDGVVEFNDFDVLANYWFMEAETTDLNDDGIVDFYDLDILTDDWLKTIIWP
jgi:hypothetical protein